MSDETRTAEAIDCTTGETFTVPITPEEAAAFDAALAAQQKQQHTNVLTAAESPERLTLIQERAAEDPAYAALAREMGVI